MEFLEYPSVSSEVRGSMSNGLLKLTDEKVLEKYFILEWICN